jgi:hypothetical protein
MIDIRKTILFIDRTINLNIDIGTDRWFPVVGIQS